MVFKKHCIRGLCKKFEIEKKKKSSGRRETDQGVTKVSSSEGGQDERTRPWPVTHLIT